MAKKQEIKLQPGQIIGGRFQVERAVARGGMATVLLVKHVTLKSSHALKILDVRSPEVRARLVQEGQVQARLRHPNIVTVTDSFDFEGCPVLVMEYVEGPSLHNFLASNRPGMAQVEHLLRGILAGLKYAHEQGLVHRDLKPANILLATFQNHHHPKITDFGIVKVLDAFREDSRKSETIAGTALGTPCYMSPEQMEDSKNVTQAADMYSLGCILYEMVCGQRAFAGPHAFTIMARVSEGIYEDPRVVSPGWPQRFYDVIDSALQLDPNQRIQSCEDFERRLFGHALASNQASMVPTLILTPQAIREATDTVSPEEGGLSRHDVAPKKFYPVVLILCLALSLHLLLLPTVLGALGCFAYLFH